MLSTVNGPSPLHDGMLIFGVSTYLTGVLNFVPLVKLDGYLALMSHLDIPHLRDRSMTDARRFLARILFGGRYSRELPQLTWAVPFGFACMLFPSTSSPSRSACGRTSCRAWASSARP